MLINFYFMMLIPVMKIKKDGGERENKGEIKTEKPSVINSSAFQPSVLIHAALGLFFHVRQ